MNTNDISSSQMPIAQGTNVEIKPGFDLNEQFEVPSPQQLNVSLLPVEQLTPDMLPEPIAAWILDIANRMNCPPDYVAVSALVMYSSIIGVGCGIKPKQKDDWVVVPNLWGGVIGSPSQLKSPSVQAALKPLDKMSAKAGEKFKLEKAAYEKELATYKAKNDALKSAITTAIKNGKTYEKESKELDNLIQPVEPKERRFKTTDVTVEKLTELLKDNKRGLLIYRDELVGLLASWDKQGHESDRAFYLESWNGNSYYTCDRIGRGTTHVEHCCLSVMGTIQPPRIQKYLTAAAGFDNDGLVQRLQLLVYPDPPNVRIPDEYPNNEAKNRATAIAEILADIHFEQFGAMADQYDKFPAFRFDSNAQTLFFNWLKELTIKIDSPDETPLMAEHLGKYRSLMPSLALIFHAIELADLYIKASNSGNEIDKLKIACPQIPLRHAEMAVKWCKYLETHARRIYGLIKTDVQLAALELAKKMLRGKVENKFTAKQIYQNGWQHLTKPELVKDAIEFLVAKNWVFEVRPEMPTAGRPSAPIYAPNPQIFADKNLLK